MRAGYLDLKTEIRACLSLSLARGNVCLEMCVLELQFPVSPRLHDMVTTPFYPDCIKFLCKHKKQGISLFCQTELCGQGPIHVFNVTLKRCCHHIGEVW